MIHKIGWEEMKKTGGYSLSGDHFTVNQYLLDLNNLNKKDFLRLSSISKVASLLTSTYVTLSRTHS